MLSSPTPYFMVSEFCSDFGLKAAVRHRSVCDS